MIYAALCLVVWSLAAQAGEVPVVHSSADVRALRRRNVERKKVHAADLLAADRGLMLRTRTADLLDGRYRLHVSLSLFRTKDPRLSDLSVFLRAGERERMLIIPHFPLDESFRGFTLDFTARGGRPVPITIRWAAGRFAIRARKTSMERPDLPDIGPATADTEPTATPDDVGADSIEEFEEAEPADGPLISVKALERMELRLAALPLIVEKCDGAKLPGKGQLPYTAGNETFTICRNGEPNAAIVVGEELKGSIERDVPVIGQLLGEELRMVTGAPFTITTKGVSDAQPSIEIGRTPRAEREGAFALTEGLNHDGFAIRITPRRMFVVGPTPSGTRYGVFFLLNHLLRVRKYHPDSLWHVAPYAPTLRLPVGELREEPDFRLRCFSGGGFYVEELPGSDIWWMTYNSLQHHTDQYPQPYGFHHNMGHIFSTYLRQQVRQEVQVALPESPTEALPLGDGDEEDLDLEDEEEDEEEGEGKEEPETFRDVLCRIFAHLLPRDEPQEKQMKRLEQLLLKAKGGWQPCFSDPDTARICFEAASAAFEKDPELRAFSLGFNDGSGWCSCDRCREVLKGQDQVTGNWYKYWNYSPVYCLFVNRVADLVAKAFPEKMVGGLAYHMTAYPPKDMAFRENVFLLQCSYLENADWSYGRASPWEGHLSHLGLYHYAYPTSIPRILLEDLQKGLKHHRAANGDLYYAEVYPDWQIEGPKYWIMTRLLWDNEADIGRLLDEYCTDLFAEAASPMREYWELCRGLYKEAQQRQTGIGAYAGPLARGRAIYPHVGRMKALLKQAEEMAQDEIAKCRVRYFREPVEHDMTILAELGRIFEQSQGPRDSAESYVDNAVRTIVELEGQSPRLAELRHRGMAKLVRHGLNPAAYVPGLAVSTFQQFARAVGEELREKEQSPDIEAFRKALEQKLHAASERCAATPERVAAWGQLREAMKPMLATMACIPQLAKPPKIDGVPDPDFAKQAARLPFYRPRKGSEQSPADLTEVCLSHDRKNLYITAVSGEDAPDVFPAHSRDGFPFLYTGDAFSMVMNPATEPEKAIFITVDARNHMYDRSVTGYSGWTTAAKLATKFHPDQKQWVVEMALPFSDLGLEPKSMSVVAANFLRHYKPDVLFQGLGPIRWLRPSSWYPPASGRPGWGSPFQTGLLLLR